MTCVVCGGKLEPRVTDMPFKVSEQTIDRQARFTAENFATFVMLSEAKHLNSVVRLVVIEGSSRDSSLRSE